MPPIVFAKSRLERGNLSPFRRHLAGKIGVGFQRLIIARIGRAFLLLRLILSFNEITSDSYMTSQVGCLLNSQEATSQVFLALSVIRISREFDHHRRIPISFRESFTSSSLQQCHQAAILAFEIVYSRNFYDYSLRKLRSRAIRSAKVVKTPPETRVLLTEKIKCVFAFVPLSQISERKVQSALVAGSHSL